MARTIQEETLLRGDREARVVVSRIPTFTEEEMCLQWRAKVCQLFKPSGNITEKKKNRVNVLFFQ